jgi:hypothetical protein
VSTVSFQVAKYLLYYHQDLQSAGKPFIATIEAFDANDVRVGAINFQQDSSALYPDNGTASFVTMFCHYSQFADVLRIFQTHKYFSISFDGTLAVLTVGWTPIGNLVPS